MCRAMKPKLRTGNGMQSCGGAQTQAPGFSRGVIDVFAKACEFLRAMLVTGKVEPDRLSEPHYGCGTMAVAIRDIQAWCASHRLRGPA